MAGSVIFGVSTLCQVYDVADVPWLVVEYWRATVNAWKR